MTARIRGVLLGLIAAVGGVGLAVVMGASAGAAGQTTTTLGSATGTPNQNICSAGINCTYLPFSNAGSPQLLVPFDGTVTSFSVNSGSATGAVHLRVLRPAGNGQFTGAGTSPAESLAGGPQTFTVSLPVKAGDVLGLDNDSSALLFETANPTAVTWYYQLPALADGATAAPNNRSTFHLLLSAVVQSSGTTTTTTSPTTTVTVTRTVTISTPTGPPPTLTNVKQSKKAWSRKKGTTFSFKLNQKALVTFIFKRGGRARGSVSVLGHAGVNRLKFKGVLSNGKTLPRGRYTASVTASTSGGKTRPATLRFRITG